MAATTTASAGITPMPSPGFWEQDREQSAPSPLSRARTNSALRERERERERDRDSRPSRKRSPQRVRARPANPAVINSILDSLDTLTAPPIITGDERFFSDSDSWSSRPRSVQSNVGSLPSLTPTTSPGFGVEYGIGLALDEDHDGTDAALPPTIKTSRPPSGLSRYSASRRPSYGNVNETAGGALHTPSISKRSSRSSLNQVKGSVSPNKLSAASWVKQNSMGQETFDTARLSRSKEIGGRRNSLRRINSRESLRTPRTEIRFVSPVSGNDAAELPPSISRAEQIIAKAQTPPIASSKRRLVLIDHGSEEQLQDYFSHAGATPPPPGFRRGHRSEMLKDVRSASPSPVRRDSEALTPDVHSTSSIPVSKRGSESEGLQEPEDGNTSRRVSPMLHPIVDSIPVRTSSLRQASCSPRPGNRKDRKSKRQSTRATKVDSKIGCVEPEPEPKAIPEDSWADLGEDDETVKRIRELREQRKSRMLDSRSFSTSEPLPTGAISDTNRDPSPAPTIGTESVQQEVASARTSEETDRRVSRTITRPTPNRAFTIDTPSKAHKVLGISESYLAQLQSSLNRTAASNSNANATSKPPPPPPPALLTQRKYSLDQSRPGRRTSLALSSHSTTPPLSLDYSYAQAIDALQGTEGEIRRKEQQQQQQTSVKPSPLKTTYLDLVSTDTLSSRDNSPTVTRKSSTKRRQDRWTLHHPDLPLDAEKKKNRRKSTSDARLGRERDTPIEPVSRRDSVDIAVTQYLQNERLSRKLRHPQTGRLITFSEVGDPNGATVFVCLGMGLTRYVTAFYDELASTLRLRLITIDRPGVGGSEPYPANDRSGPLSWPDDVVAICQHLGIPSFSLLAHSAGAIYALASALVLPQMIQGKVHLLAPWIPPSQLQAVSRSTAPNTPPAAALPRSQRLLRVLPTPFLKAANSSFMTATSASLKPNIKRGKGAQTARLETIHQNTVSDYPLRRPQTSTVRPSSDGDAHRPDARRESMMLMDQFMPSINPMENFPIPLSRTESHSSDATARRGSLIMSATATPMDPSFEYAYSALNAAEHEARRRKSEFTARLTQSTWELATKDSNPATDLLVCLERNREVGFKYTDVGCEVVITHGSEDKRVPVGNVKWLAEQMSQRSVVGSRTERAENVGGLGEGKGGCEVRVLQGEGHGLMASPLIMGDVLTEIAGYWQGKRWL